MAGMTTETFLWHDYETFGANPRRDRPCQFAALRTDTDLQPVDEPVVIYCQPASDVLPDPEACLITGITPQHALEHGEPEYAFARRIQELMSRPGTCSVGYNNFRFDDEVTRFLFWRNFIEPYGREYANGNSRFDLIDVLRMTRALRPEGIEWPNRDDGSPGFRLEDLAAANGMATDRAHDALADVENTLGMARLVRTHQPKLWNWALSLRARHTVEALVHRRDILLHASSRFPAAEYCMAPVLPLFQHPQIKSQWLVWNLRENPAEFSAMDPELLSDLYWTPARDLPEDLKRLPVKWIRTNRCPMLSPIGVLDAAARERTGIDPARADRYAEALVGDEDLLAELQQVFSQPHEAAEADAEQALYAGFVSRADRALADRVPNLAPDQVAEWINREREPFGDDRLNTLLLLFAGRHAPDTLDPEHRRAWDDWRRRRLYDDPDLASLRFDEYQQKIALLLEQKPERGDLLKALLGWPETLGIGAEPRNQ